jgi:hypothetical protein
VGPVSVGCDGVPHRQGVSSTPFHAALPAPDVEITRETGHFAASRERHGVCLILAEATMNPLLLVILLVLVLGALPTWPYSQGWGYYPSGGLGLLLLILIIAAVLRGGGATP